MQLVVTTRRTSLFLSRYTQCRSMVVSSSSSPFPPSELQFRRIPRHWAGKPIAFCEESDKSNNKTKTNGGGGELPCLGAFMARWKKRDYILGFPMNYPIVICRTEGEEGDLVPLEEQEDAALLDRLVPAAEAALRRDHDDTPTAGQGEEGPVAPQITLHRTPHFLTVSNLFMDDEDTQKEMEKQEAEAKKKTPPKEKEDEDEGFDVLTVFEFEGCNYVVIRPKEQQFVLGRADDKSNEFGRFAFTEETEKGNINEENKEEKTTTATNNSSRKQSEKDPEKALPLPLRMTLVPVDQAEELMPLLQLQVCTTGTDFSESDLDRMDQELQEDEERLRTVGSHNVHDNDNL